MGFLAERGPEKIVATGRICSDALDAVPAAAVDAKKAYLEIPARSFGVNATRWDAPYVSDWVPAIRPSLIGDLDGDGLVGSADLDIIRAVWGRSAVAAVMESAAGVLLCIVPAMAAIRFVRHGRKRRR